jgi:peroxiredoxin
MKIWLLSLCYALPFLSSAQQQFSLNGELKNQKAPIATVYLFYYSKGERKVDSSKVASGKYQFTGALADPTLATLRARYVSEKTADGKTRAYNFKRDIAQLFMDPAPIQITHVDSFGNYQVKGSKSDLDYRQLDQAAQPYYTKLQTLYDQYNGLRTKNDAAAMNAKGAELMSLEKEMKEKVFLAFSRDHAQSPVALFALEQFVGEDPDINVQLVEPVFNQLPEQVRQSAEGNELANRIAQSKVTAIGSEAQEFTQPDTSGNPVSLSSFRGKYVLLDFWASWCGPCRQENPNVVRAYEKYRNKGFAILGVSLDKPNDKLKWLKAIHDDGLGWTHVSDLQYWNNAAARQYGVQSIPQNFLLDPQGRIIGKNLRGDDLQKKLAEIYKD